jgi:hypothetical protein
MAAWIFRISCRWHNSFAACCCHYSHLSKDYTGKKDCVKGSGKCGTQETFYRRFSYEYYENGPASGAIIEFVIPEKGRYTFVDHSFADADMGAMGSFEAQ